MWLLLAKCKLVLLQSDVPQALRLQRRRLGLIHCIGKLLKPCLELSLLNKVFHGASCPRVSLWYERVQTSPVPLVAIQCTALSKVHVHTDICNVVALNVNCHPEAD